MDIHYTVTVQVIVMLHGYDEYNVADHGLS
jgi:hypothetical protein